MYRTCGRGSIMPGLGPPMPATGPARPCSQTMCEETDCVMTGLVQVMFIATMSTHDDRRQGQVQEGSKSAPLVPGRGQLLACHGLRRAPCLGHPAQKHPKCQR